MDKSSIFTNVVKQGSNILVKTIERIKKDNEKKLPYLMEEVKGVKSGGKVRE